MVEWGWPVMSAINLGPSRWGRGEGRLDSPERNLCHYL